MTKEEIKALKQKFNAFEKMFQELEEDIKTLNKDQQREILESVDDFGNLRDDISDLQFVAIQVLDKMEAEADE